MASSGGFLTGAMNNNWVIITGADRGIGESLTELLADMDYGVVMACRDVDSAGEIFEHVRYITSNHDVRLMPLDLSSLDSVAAFARSIREKGYNIRALVNNAAVYRKTYAVSQDGFEQTLAVNYLGPYLLTRLLLPVLRDSQGGASVINTVSSMVKFGRIDSSFFDLSPEKYRPMRAYAASKLALLLFTHSLNQALQADDRVAVDAFNPGWVNTRLLALGNWLDPLFNILVRPLLKTSDQAAQQAFHALFPEKQSAGGVLFTARRQMPIRDMAAVQRSPQQWLFRHTEELLARAGYELPEL